MVLAKIIRIVGKIYATGKINKQHQINHSIRALTTCLDQFSSDYGSRKKKEFTPYPHKRHWHFQSFQQKGQLRHKKRDHSVVAKHSLCEQSSCLIHTMFPVLRLFGFYQLPYRIWYSCKEVQVQVQEIQLFLNLCDIKR